MSEHVDIVKNDFANSKEVLLARVSLGTYGAAVEIRTTEQAPDNLHAFLDQGIYNPAAGELVYAEKEPQRFWESLPSSLHGSYFFATSPHDDAACPFRHTNDVPLGSTAMSRA